MKVLFNRPLKLTDVKDAAPVTERYPPEARLPAVRSFEIVDVPEPCTMRLPVVVAPPLMVRPVACVPLPMVVDAVARKPLVNVWSAVKVLVE